MMDYKKARDILLEQVGFARRELIDELEGNYRNWKQQRESLAKYQEYLKASDKLAGYKVEDEGGNDESNTRKKE